MKTVFFLIKGKLETTQARTQEFWNLKNSSRIIFSPRRGSVNQKGNEKKIIPAETKSVFVFIQGKYLKKSDDIIKG